MTMLNYQESAAICCDERYLQVDKRQLSDKRSQFSDR